MSTYREIVGKKIKKLSSDPSAGTDGEMWYNSTTGTLRGPAILEAWSSGSPLTTNREGAAGFGLQTAAVTCGGETPPVTNLTEEYNGTGWATGGTLNTARYRVAGCGTLTAGIIFGGAPVPPTANGAATETYNGTAWTTSPYTLNTPRNSLAGAGTSTSCLAMGGGPSYKNDSEEFDGEGWTSTPNLNTAKHSSMAAGANAEGVISFGGYTSSPPTAATDATESWNGSSWTTVNSMNTGRYGAYGAGTQTAGIVTGGIVGPGTMQSKTEAYDGTSWTEKADLATARGRLTTAGTTTTALACGGQTPSLTTATEEYNNSTTAVTAAAFASGTNLPVARGQGGGCGTQTAALQCGGIADSPTSNTTTSFEYDGSSWAASPGSLNAATRNNSNFGIQTAAVTVGSLGPVTAAVDTYNGSTWTSGTSYPSPVSNIGAAGTNTAGLAWGGDQDPGYLTTTNEYNGSWTGGGAIPTGRSNSACAGTQTAGLSVGGYVGSAAPSATVVATSLEYNGSAWTAGGTDTTSRYNAGAAGIQTSALIFGGNTPSNTAVATLYDGTSFVTQPSMGTARFLQTQGLGATSTAALAAAGQTTTRVATVEEFTGETTSLNIETLTQS